jgi:hypothetical protein
MEREKFVKLVEEALGGLPTAVRKRIHNVAVLVENVPPERRPRRRSRNAGINRVGRMIGILVAASSKGCQLTKKSVFDLPGVPIASCSIRRTSSRLLQRRRIPKGNPSDSTP